MQTTHIPTTTRFVIYHNLKQAKVIQEQITSAHIPRQVAFENALIASRLLEGTLPVLYEQSSSESEHALLQRLSRYIHEARHQAYANSTSLPSAYHLFELLSDFLVLSRQESPQSISNTEQPARIQHQSVNMEQPSATPLPQHAQIIALSSQLNESTMTPVSAQSPSASYQQYSQEEFSFQPSPSTETPQIMLVGTDANGKRHHPEGKIIGAPIIFQAPLAMQQQQSTLGVGKMDDSGITDSRVQILTEDGTYSCMPPYESVETMKRAGPKRPVTTKKTVATKKIVSTKKTVETKKLVGTRKEVTISGLTDFTEVQEDVQEPSQVRVRAQNVTHVGEEQLGGDVRKQQQPQQQKLEGHKTSLLQQKLQKTRKTPLPQQRVQKSNPPSQAVRQQQQQQTQMKPSPGKQQRQTRSTPLPQHRLPKSRQPQQQPQAQIKSFPEQQTQKRKSLVPQQRVQRSHPPLQPQQQQKKPMRKASPPQQQLLSSQLPPGAHEESQNQLPTYQITSLPQQVSLIPQTQRNQEMVYTPSGQYKNLHAPYTNPNIQPVTSINPVESASADRQMPPTSSYGDNYVMLAEQTLIDGQNKKVVYVPVRYGDGITEKQKQEINSLANQLSESATYSRGISTDAQTKTVNSKRSRGSNSKQRSVPSKAQKSGKAGTNKKLRSFRKVKKVGHMIVSGVSLGLLIIGTASKAMEMFEKLSGNHVPQIEANHDEDDEGDEEAVEETGDDEEAAEETEGNE